MAEAKKGDKDKEKGKEGPAPIIIKKISGDGGAGHGGAWKIALADMMTAMMAFFLLMWLLGATSEAQRKSIADYFKPTPKSLIQTGQLAGSNGVLGGRSILDPEGMPSAAFQTSLLDLANPKDTEGGKEQDKGPQTDPAPESQQDTGKGAAQDEENKGGAQDQNKKGGAQDGEKTGGDRDGAKSGSGSSSGSGSGEKSGGSGDQSGGSSSTDGMSEEAKKEIAAQLDQKNFDKVEKELMERMSADQSLADLKGQVHFVRETEGLRIEVVDKSDFSMFALGTNKLLPRAQELMQAIAKTVNNMPNKVVVRGHTDSYAFSGSDRNNWMLSTERAESTRQLLEKQGLDPDRFARIEGVADKDPFVAEDAYDPRNRRISITLQYRDPAVKAP
jgi:chemotaxis protein MotB